MNKKDLLSRVAKQKGIHPVAFSLASSELSESSSIARAKVLSRRAGLLTLSTKVALPLLAVIALAAVYCCAPATPATDATFFSNHVVPAIRGAYAWFIMMVTFGLMLGAVKLAGGEWLANPDERRFLKPVAGTQTELEVASLLENGGSSVTAWRDIAMQEHGHLLGFDYEVMRVLFQLRAAEEREAAKKAEQLAVAAPAELAA